MKITFGPGQNGGRGRGDGHGRERPARGRIAALLHPEEDVRHGGERRGGDERTATFGIHKTCFAGHLLGNPFSEATEKGPS